MSKLEALALRVEERRSTSESAEVDEAEERPDRLRSRLRLKARSASEPEQPFSDVSKLAKGPDGTTGFLRHRTIKPFGFSAEVAEFVPSFAVEPPGPRAAIARAAGRTSARHSFCAIAGRAARARPPPP